MFRCKAPEILQKKAYVVYTSFKQDDGNAVDGRFGSACQVKKFSSGTSGSKSCLFSRE